LAKRKKNEQISELQVDDDDDDDDLIIDLKHTIIFRLQYNNNLSS